MKKNRIAILTCAAALCTASLLTLTACGNSEESSQSTGKVSVNNSSTESSQSSESSQTETETTTEQTTQAESTTKETTETTTQPATTTEAETEKVTTTAPPETKAETTSQPTQTTLPVTKAKVSVPKTLNGQFSKEDACAVYNNCTITLDGTFEDCLSALGNPDSKTENTNCLRGSAGFTYTYGNMQVNTYLKNNKEYIEDIMVMQAGNTATGKGIQVGSNKSAIMTAYGKTTNSDESTMTYTSGNYNIMFYIQEQKVFGFHIYYQ